jgi:hypothetical protein
VTSPSNGGPAYAVVIWRLIVRVHAAVCSEAGVETFALPSRDTCFLTLVALLDAGFL